MLSELVNFNNNLPTIALVIHKFLADVEVEGLER